MQQTPSSGERDGVRIGRHHDSGHVERNDRLLIGHAQQLELKRRSVEHRDVERSSSGVTRAAFCNSALQVWCTLNQTCGAYDPQADCGDLSIWGSLSVGAPLGVACPDPGMAFSPGAASACLSALQTAVSGSDCASPLLLSAPNRFSAFFAPGVSEGSACQTDANDCLQRPDGGFVGCASTGASACGGICQAGSTLGQSCNQNEFATCLEGTCLSTNVCGPGVDGGPCDFSNNGCDISVDYCDFSLHQGSTGFCAPRQPTGAPCFFQQSGVPLNNCLPGNTCAQPPDGGTQLTCWANAGLGEACTEGYGCGGPACQGNCETGICAGGICIAATAQLGEPCREPVQCIGGYCNNPDGGVGVCAAPLTEGQSCPQVPFGNSCAGYLADSLYCYQGTCQQLLPGAGEPCDGTSCRAGDYCDSSSTCRTLKLLGAACTPAGWGCSLSLIQTTPTDGGVGGTIDQACLPEPDGGGPVCQPVPLCQ